MNSPRVRLALLAVVAACGLVGLWWTANHDPRLRFLPTQAPANWVLYPAPPDTEMHPAVPAWTVFRREFVLPTAAPGATLELRAFTDFQVTVNAQALTNRPARKESWKVATQLDLGAVLQPGTNRISVIVTNQSGPPALWAVLRQGAFTLVTDTNWEASLVGAIWQPAYPAGEPRPRLAGHPLIGAETAKESFGRVAWMWLGGLALIAVALAYGKSIGERLGISARLSASTRRDWWPLGLVVVLWVALLANNLPQLPTLFGFDTDGHTEYISFLQKQGRLPLAHEGWQMYQPPLYYLLAAGLLGVTGNEMGEATTWLVRAMSGGIGLAHLLFLWLALRRLFPQQRSAQARGLLFAASLPALLCVSQFITNEGLAAMLSTATLYFALRTNQSDPISARLALVTGACLGLALLAKFSAIVLAPFVFALLASCDSRRSAEAKPRQVGPIRLLTSAATSRAPWLALAACLLVCGWHYGRVWWQFGNPLVGNWSPESGFAWWQENGFTTANYFCSFGRALTAPLFSGFDSLGDGLYSTLWADGLCSGGTKMSFRPPWNYSLMLAGLWLALVPSLLAVLGAASFLKRWVQQATLESLLWPALLAAYGLAVAVMTLRVPSYAQAKSVYALGALLPLCACLLAGLQTVRTFHRRLHDVGVALLTLWMLNSFASFWIRHGAAATHEMLAANHLDLGHPTEALAQADHALQLNPASVLAAGQRSAALRALGRVEEARTQAAQASAQHGAASGAWLELANLAVAHGDHAGAAALALDAAAKLPDDPLATHDAALWSLQAGNPPAAEELFRRALRIRFANQALHFLLGKALAAQGRNAEALTHLRQAVRLKPDWAMALSDLAWTLASHPDAALRNGAEAVTLAERACAVTQHQQPQMLGTLAAAYAEAGRFADAVRTAEAAMAAATAAGMNEIVARNEALLQLYRAGKAYHDPAPTVPDAPVKN